MRLMPVLAVAILACGIPAAAENETPRERLFRAERLVETPPKDYEAALTIYAAVADLPDQPPDVRADALVGAAKMHLHFDRTAQARKYLKRITADEALRQEARDWARSELARLEPAPVPAGNGPVATPADLEELLAREQAKRREEARDLLRRARIAFNARNYKAARNMALEALSKDFDNPDAKRLLDEIESNRPESGDLLQRLIHFLQTAQLEEYQHLKSRVEELRGRGKRASDKQEYAEADRLFREAIRMIDGSDFLTAGGALDIESLATVRTEIMAHLAVVHTQGRAKGLEFDPEPPLPDVRHAGGLQREFYGLLARTFTPREGGEEPLRFYDFAPRRRQGAVAKPLLNPSFAPGLQASLATGSLTRAGWAERWIRSNIGARWSDPAAMRTGAAARQRARILTRFGNLICAQHREIEHARIRKLQESFARQSPPLTIKVHLYAAGPGGAVRAAEALRIVSAPGEVGTSVVDRAHVIENAVRALDGLTNLKDLGGATLEMDGESAVTLALTRLTAEHPYFETTPAPAITIPDDLARYGLWLDLFGEDMPQGTGRRARSGALSVRARVIQPSDTQHSHVVPRRGRSDPSWTRLPLMTEQPREADVELPHFGTFAMFGLANPFPDTRAEHGELVVLIGLRPSDRPTPEAPRTPTSPRIVPAADKVREYALGPLATEVEDLVVGDPWPELHTVAEGVSAGARRRARDEHLSWLLGRMANIDNAGSAAVRPILVHDGVATANLAPEEHVQLQRAVMRLNNCKTHHYVVNVESAVMPRARWSEWRRLEGVRTNDRGSLRATGAPREMMASELTTLRETEHLFNMAFSPKLARSTQKVLRQSTRSRDITKDLRMRITDHGRQAYTAIAGKAEEGLVVEVRPSIEQVDAAMRDVSIRVRAARLRTIESRAYPGANQPAARYDVPLWHETTTGSFAEVSDVEILDDRTTVFLPLELPGKPDELIVVSVTVRRVQ